MAAVAAAGLAGEPPGAGLPALAGAGGGDPEGAGLPPAAASCSTGALLPMFAKSGPNLILPSKTGRSNR